MLVDAVIEALTTRDEPTLSEFGPAPAFMIELHRVGDAKHWGIPDSEPFYAQLVAERLGVNDLKRLRDALLEYSSNPAGAYLPTAIWALGKLFDHNLKGFFVNQLRTQLGAAQPTSGVIGECLNALSNLGENFTPGIFSALEEEKNIALAKSYIESLGAEP